MTELEMRQKFKEAGHLLKQAKEARKIFNDLKFKSGDAMLSETYGQCLVIEIDIDFSEDIPTTVIAKIENERIQKYRVSVEDLLPITEAAKLLYED